MTRVDTSLCKNILHSRFLRERFDKLINLSFSPWSALLLKSTGSQRWTHLQAQKRSSSNVYSAFGRSHLFSDSPRVSRAEKQFSGTGVALVTERMSGHGLWVAGLGLSSGLKASLCYCIRRYWGIVIHFLRCDNGVMVIFKSRLLKLKYLWLR